MMTRTGRARVGPLAHTLLTGLSRAALLVLPLLAGGCARPVTILQLSDLHILGAQTTAYPRAVVQAMNQEGGDLMLVCGDLATDGKREELVLAKAVLDELEMPYYPVIGNHDVRYAGDREEEQFRELFSLEGNSYHFVKKGIHFVAVDPGCGTDFENNRVPPGVMEWLRETLAIIPDQAPIIVFTHYPYAEGVTYQTPNAAEVLALFREKRLLAVISGHFHGNTEIVQDGVLFTTTACSSSTRGNHDGTKPKGYRIFRIDGQRHITTEFRAVPEE